ncbi:hypothetical protein [Indioceanicola profundi]|uniref:hypothetical protein n=1 Tax=Indioceanicola profundi TaxID=2220096 RepID=UPI000E6A9685|nr:hypothetical protein [Indioceanicola profundi]
MNTDLNSLHDRARSTALSDAAQALRENGQIQQRRGDTVMEDGSPNGDSSATERAGDGQPRKETKPAGGPQRQRRARNRRSSNGDPAGAAAEEAVALLADATQELAAARREIDRLRGELDAANARLLEETQEAALMRRQRDGLQHRTDYLEEKLELVTRALNRARAPWWKRR